MKFVCQKIYYKKVINILRGVLTFWEELNCSIPLLWKLFGKFRGDNNRTSFSGNFSQGDMELAPTMGCEEIWEKCSRDFVCKNWGSLLQFPFDMNSMAFSLHYQDKVDCNEIFPLSPFGLWPFLFLDIIVTLIYCKKMELKFSGDMPRIVFEDNIKVISILHMEIFSNGHFPANN